MAYTPKDWALSDDITEVDLDHIEQGIADVTDDFEALRDTLATAGLVISTNRTASVDDNINTYTRPSSPYLVVATVTPTVNSRLILSGFVTLLHSATSGTPGLAWGILTDAGSIVQHGPYMTRCRESATTSVALPVGGAVDLTADVEYTLHLGVSSTVAGTITIVGGRSEITATVIPV